jgi:polyvinyl alcohol dehydrogenase (cytochrome)
VSRKKITTGIVAAVVATGVAASAFAATPNATWLTSGQNQQNTRSQPAENTIGVQNANLLDTKWSVTTGGDVSATPAVDGNTVYFPDRSGNLYAVDRVTGAAKWTASLSALTGVPGDYARATPAIAGQTLIIGNQGGKFATPATPAAQGGGWVVALDKKTGALLWRTQVEAQFSAIITQSAVVNGNTAYVGVASNEEAFANAIFAGQPYTCCTFRGSLVALDLATGAIKWKTYMVPAGYSGGAIWGSTPALDLQRGRVYVATGNNYSMPVAVTQCVVAANAAHTDPRPCLAADDYFDSIMALDMKTGAVTWAFRALPTDAWNVDCGLPGFVPGDTNDPTNCPPGQGPDYDYGQGPALLSARIGGKPVDLVGAGAKSGIYTALNRDTGAVIWQTQVGPGGLTGGLQWGSATDGTRIYVAESNSSFVYSPGWWSALDPATGNELWRTYDASTGLYGTFGIFGYSAQGPVSVANGVVYACSLSPNGPNLFAMNAATGATLWQFASGSSCLGGAAIVNGTVYWGTGYGTFAPLTTSGNKLFAFSLNAE